MILKSQTMRFVLNAMMEAEAAWERSGRNKSEMINPDVPVTVQCGDFAYEISSVGGDGDIEGFVICLKPEPVGKWEGLEYVNLTAKQSPQP